MPGTEIAYLPEIQNVDFWTVCATHFPQEHDWLVSLVRAFRVNRVDFIIINRVDQEFQIQAASLGRSLGLLDFTEIDSEREQYTEWRYRLTELGQRVILDPRAPSLYIT